MRTKNMQSFAFAVKPEWLSELDATVDAAKNSDYALHAAINRSEMARQASLIGFAVIQCLGKDFNGAAVTSLLIEKKITCKKEI